MGNVTPIDANYQQVGKESRVQSIKAMLDPVARNEKIAKLFRSGESVRTGGMFRLVIPLCAG